MLVRALLALQRGSLRREHRAPRFRGENAAEVSEMVIEIVET